MSVTSSDEPKSTRQYKKDLGVWHVVFFTIGAILGPAIAFAPVYTVALAGPSGILAWPIAMVLIIPLALVYAELGTAWPKAGGVAYYPHKSNGPLVGAINGWASFVGYTLSGPVIIFAIVEYLSFYYPAFYANGTLTILGILAAEGVLLLIFIVNILRIKHMGNINSILTVITIILLTVMIIGIGLYVKPSNLTSAALGGFTPYGATGLFAAITLTVFGYAGFRQPIDYSEEVKDPGKSIPLAIVLSIVSAAIIFSIEAFVFAGAVNFAGFNLSAGNWAAFFQYSSPYATEAQTLGLPIIIVIAIVVAIIATFKDGYIYYGGSARVAHTLAKEDHYFPSRLSHLNEKGLPIYTIYLIFGITIVLLALGRSLASIISIAVDALIVGYGAGCVSLAVLRKAYPDQKRPFKLPAIKFFSPYTFVIANLLVYWSGWTAVRVIIPVDIFGVVLIAFYSRNRQMEGKPIIYGLWMPIYFLAIMAMSYFGSSFFGGRNLIIFPYDIVMFIVVTLGFFYFGYYSGLKWIEHSGEKM